MKELQASTGVFFQIVNVLMEKPLAPRKTKAWKPTQERKEGKKVEGKV